MKKGFHDKFSKSCVIYQTETVQIIRLIHCQNSSLSKLCKSKIAKLFALQTLPLYSNKTSMIYEFIKIVIFPFLCVFVSMYYLLHFNFLPNSCSHILLVFISAPCCEVTTTVNKNTLDVKKWHGQEKLL